jgi:hypothetical protein
MNPNIKVLITRAESILNDWLVDNTEYTFDEQPEIDDARQLLIEAIDLLEKE